MAIISTISELRGAKFCMDGFQHEVNHLREYSRCFFNFALRGQGESYKENNQNNIRKSLIN